MSKEDQFVYSYSAKQQDEIRYIKDKYLKKDEAGINKIRELDKNVERRASLTAVLMGITGVMTFGGGFSMIMTQPGTVFAILGAIISLFGIILCFAAYICYPKILHRLRNRYAPIIVKMCDEALGQDK